MIQIVHARTFLVLARSFWAVRVEITSCGGISSFCAFLRISWSRLLACSTSGTPIFFMFIAPPPCSSIRASSFDLAGWYPPSVTRFTMETLRKVRLQTRLVQVHPRSNGRSVEFLQNFIPYSLPS